jgi:hypothetical protein
MNVWGIVVALLAGLASGIVFGLIVLVVFNRAVMQRRAEEQRQRRQNEDPHR